MNCVAIIHRFAAVAAVPDVEVLRTPRGLARECRAESRHMRTIVCNRRTRHRRTCGRGACGKRERDHRQNSGLLARKYNQYLPWRKPPLHRHPKSGG